MLKFHRNQWQRVSRYRLCCREKIFGENLP